MATSGFSPNTDFKPSQEITLDVFGMTCTNCALRVEKGLQSVEGVTEARVNFANKTAYIQTMTPMSPNIFEDKVQSVGYKAHLHSKENQKKTFDLHKAEIRDLKLRFVASAVLSFPILLTMANHLGEWSGILPIPHLFHNFWFQLILVSPIQFGLGFPFYRGAFYAIQNKSSNMDVLVVLGTSAAFLYSCVQPVLYFETSALLITFILLGKWMETIAKGKSSDSIRALMELTPAKATIRKDQIWQEIPLEYLRVGDQILVKANETFPTDGTVVEGVGFADESAITGESLPVDKSVGSFVMGSSRNGSSSLVIKATKVGEQTILAKIIKTVEDTQSSKSPLQKIADGISGIFVPIILGLAVANFLFWFFGWDVGNANGAIEKSIAILVIACPCALGLATPISILVGTGRGASQGILFRNAESLENASKIKILGFDKTGTLTEGNIRVVHDLLVLDGAVISQDSQVLSPNKDSLVSQWESRVASAVIGSEHVLSRGIFHFYKSKGVSPISFEKMNTVSGSGIKAIVQGSTVLVGKKDYLEQEGISIPVCVTQIASDWETKGCILVYSYVRFQDDDCFFLFGLKDSLKSNSKKAIENLKKMGIVPVLLTGDRSIPAQEIAKQVGIDTVHFELSPTDKSEILKSLSSSSSSELLGMAGDGINDAPALALADVGIAMGNGTELAMESAGIILVKGDLSKIVEAIALSRATVKNIHQNFFWALAYNTIGIPIAGMGLLAPWLCGVVMALSSLSVVLNALRLRKV